MGRLIDADLLKKNCKCTGTFESNFQCVSLKTLGDVIDAQPTAYDPNKVVQQLENLKTINVDIGFETIVSTLRKDVVMEIVKGGGADAEH